MTIKTFALATAICAAATGASAITQWGGNGHYYDVVFGNITWTAAKAAAEASSHNGQAGYLVTITSAAEQAFLNTLNPNGTNLWIGAQDLVTEGVWVWDGGPEAGQTLASTYANWNAGEPNNVGGEDYGVGWWSGDRWNDLPNIGQPGYIVEYNGAQVPLPAGLPLILTGLGALGFAARRRKG